MKKTPIFPIITLLFCFDYATAQENTDSVPQVGFNQVVSNTVFKKGGLSDPLQILLGQATGVWSLKKGSNPAVSNSLMIRGNSSELNSGILYIIDGVYGADPGLLVADDIESFEILKDAASTARYGSQGSAGVIIIKTRRYQGDKKVSVHVNSFLSINSSSKKLDLLSADEYRKFVDQNDIWGFTDGGSNTDWQDEIFRTTVSQNYNLAVSGKIKNSGYQITFFHQNIPGIVQESSNRMSGLNMHVTQSALQNRLNLNVSVLASTSSIDNLPNYLNKVILPDNVFYQALRRNPTEPVYEADGKTYAQTTGLFNYHNPLSILKYTTNTAHPEDLNLNFGLKYKISEALHVDVNLGSLFYNNDLRFLQLPQAFSHYADSISRVAGQKKRNLNFETGFNFSKSLKATHHITARLDYAYHLYKEDLSNIKLSGDKMSIYSNQNKHYNTIIGSFEYNFKQRYFVNVVANNEYTEFSMRGTEITQQKVIKHASLFPALTIGWKMNNEKFLRSFHFINNLMLKGGYGITGNGQGDYLNFRSDVPEAGVDLEMTQEMSLGLDFGLWANRISGSIVYYERNTRNAITLVPQQMPPSVVPFAYENGARYRNKGIEVNLQAKPVEREVIKWVTSLSYFRNKNEIITSKSLLPRGVGEFAYGYDDSELYTQLMQTGNALVFYLPVSAGYTRYGDPIYHSEDGGFTDELGNARREIMGQPFPKYELGWTNHIQFSRVVDLMVALRYAGGHKIYNATRMALSNGHYLPLINISTEGTENYLNGYNTAIISDIYLEDASFLRIENITLGYTPKIKSISEGRYINFYVSATHLLTLTKYTGFDPAGYDGGVDLFNVYPLARSFAFGIRLSL